MQYRTIRAAASAEFVEKRSRFIGYISPVTTQEDAAAFIDSIRSKHWDATHNVPAYIIREGNICRFSDDGEPQGTAGMPALNVLQKEGLTDCVLVVTRYFGGILLGGGGLVRAYSHAAKIAVDAGHSDPRGVQHSENPLRLHILRAARLAYPGAGRHSRGHGVRGRGDGENENTAGA